MSERFRHALKPGVQAVRANWQPFVLIWMLAVTLVVAYYRSPWLQGYTVALDRIKTEGGIPFAFLTGVITGGLVPELAKLLTGKLRSIGGGWLREWLYVGAVYGIVSVEVFVFYNLQAALFGNGRDLGTLATKTLIDQFVFSPTLSIPTAVLLLEWRRAGFRWAPLRESLGQSFYSRKVLPSLLPCWALWVPTLFAIYSLPLDLQFWLASLTTAAWSIIFIFIADAGRRESA